MISQGLFHRCKALLRNPSVTALVIVVDSAEFLSTGLPLDRYDQLHWVGGALSIESRLIEAALRKALVCPPK